MSHRRSHDDSNAADVNSQQRQRRPASISELAEWALDINWDPSRELKHWLRIAERSRNRAKAQLEDGNLESAFMYLARAATIVLEKLPTHPHYYPSLTEPQRQNLGLNGQDILNHLGQLKPTLVDRFNNWRAVHPNSPLVPLDELDQQREQYEQDTERVLAEEAVRWRHEREERQRQDNEARVQRQSTQHPPHQVQHALNRRTEAAISAARHAASSPVHDRPTADYAFSRLPSHEHARGLEQERIGRRRQQADVEVRNIRQLEVGGALSRVVGPLGPPNPSEQVLRDHSSFLSEGAVIDLLHTKVLSSKVHYQSLLQATGTKAQKILDILHKLLASPDLVDDLIRRSVLMALLRLAAACGQYPQQLRLDGVHCEPSALTAGRFGEVYRGQYKGQRVCLKIFKLYERSHIDHLNKGFSREAIVWSGLHHQNVLPFFGIYHVADPRPRIGLVSPWMDNGNLSEYLRSHTDARRLPFVQDVLSGLQYLHQNQVVHGDLKGVNILVDVNMSARLADFGLSSVMDVDVLRWTSLETMTRAGGTTRWVAPEMIEDSEEGGLLRPSFASDIYSLASVMIEIFTGRMPFYGIPNDITVLYKVMRGIRPTRPTYEMAPELNDGIWGIMQDCWSATPADRPTVDEVINRLLVIVPFLPRPQTAEAEPWINLSAQRDSTLSELDQMFLVNAFDLS